MAEKSRSGSPVGLAAIMLASIRCMACIICDANVASTETAASDGALL